MRNEKVLPTEKELNDYKVQIRDKVSKDGENESSLFHWPEMPLSEKYASKLLRYRIAKHLVGYTTATGRKVKAYGIHVLAALGVLAVFIYGESKNPYFADSFLTFLGMFILFFIIFYFVHFNVPKWAAIQQIRKGEKIPVARRDVNGRTQIVTVEAKETVTNVFTLPEGSQDFLLPFGITIDRGSNHSEVWWFKHYHYNMLWGSAMYEELDVARLDVWGKVESWLPYELEDAMEITRKKLSKDNIPEEEIIEVQKAIKEIYAALSIIDENQKEIEERYGRKLIKIKMSKTNNAFISAWSGIMKNIEKYHLDRLNEREAANKQESKLIEMMNRAMLVETERGFDIGLMNKRVKDQADAMFLMAERLRRNPDEVYLEQETAQRAPDVREATDVVSRVRDENLKKMIEEGWDGTEKDE